MWPLFPPWDKAIPMHMEISVLQPPEIRGLVRMAPEHLGPFGIQVVGVGSRPGFMPHDSKKVAGRSEPGPCSASTPLAMDYVSSGRDGSARGDAEVGRGGPAIAPASAAWKQGAIVPTVTAEDR